MPSAPPSPCLSPAGCAAAPGATAGEQWGDVAPVAHWRPRTASNAYVNGLGPTKRVVLFDTLIRDFSPEQTRLVVAHELGHVRHRDVPASLLQAVIKLNADHGIALPEAMGMVTWKVADILGLRDRGHLKTGLRADLVRFKVLGATPVLSAVWSQGERAF